MTGHGCAETPHDPSVWSTTISTQRFDEQNETQETWERAAQRSQARACQAVDWPLLLEPIDAKPVASPPVELSDVEHASWLDMLSSFDRLRAHRDEDTLLRRSVEAIREGFEVERAAIFLLTPDGQSLSGTWGTGANGATTDERHLIFSIGQSHRDAFLEVDSGLSRWQRLPNVPLLSQGPKGTFVLRRGDNFVIPITHKSGHSGLIACDNALSGSKMATLALLKLAVFSSLLGELLQSLNVGNRAANPSSAVGASAGLAESSAPAFETRAGANVQSDPLILSVLQVLADDPNLPRDKLARRVGLSAGRLGKLFKEGTRETLSDYRNRIRLNRFFSLVAPGGGNLLQASLDAGFGSYAQFNRVFRARYACSPKTFLKKGRA